MNNLITFFAQYLIYIIGLAVFSYAIFRLTRSEQQQLIVELIIAIVFAFVFMKIAGKLYYNPRPFVEGNFSPLFPHGADNGFPSNHSLVAAIMAISLWVYSKRAALFLITLACLVGLGRVLAGVHHTEDIIGGFLIAGLSVWLAYLAANFIRSKLSSLSS